MSAANAATSARRRTAGKRPPEQGTAAGKGTNWKQARGSRLGLAADRRPTANEDVEQPLARVATEDEGRQQKEGGGQVEQNLSAHRTGTSISASYSSKAETRIVTSSRQSPSTGSIAPCTV